jgi:hypothetical protein
VVFHFTVSKLLNSLASPITIFLPLCDGRSFASFKTLRMGYSLAAHGEQNRALVDHHIGVAISPKMAAAVRCTKTFSDPCNAASDGTSADNSYSQYIF